MRLIDADYVLKGLKNFNDRKHGNPHFLNGIETAKEIITNAPTIDAVPVVHGEWKDDCDYRHLLNCSLCGCSVGYGTNFCTNCGAKMDGGK